MVEIEYIPNNYRSLEIIVGSILKSRQGKICTLSPQN